MSGGQVSSKYLQSFEKDMNSLRRVSEGLLVSISILKSRYLDNHHKQKLFSIVQEQDIGNNGNIFLKLFFIYSGLDQESICMRQL